MKNSITIKEILNKELPKEEITQTIKIGILNSTRYIVCSFLFHTFPFGFGQKINWNKVKLKINSKMISLVEEQSLLSLGITKDFTCFIMFE